MEHDDSSSPNHSAHEGSRPYSAWKGAAIMVGVIIGFFVLREHWGHVLGFAPYLLLLACPLMHVFMHGGHGHHHDSDHKEHQR
jgi:Protein of unknown function (DUF2933)